MKFKNIKNKAQKTKFPSNSRTIPDFAFLTFYRKSLNTFIAIVFVLTAVIVGIDLYDNIKAKQNIDYQRDKLTQELKFWEEFMLKQKNYRDAYLSASVLEYRLGDTVKARAYLKKGLVLDPNSEIGREIENFLKNR